LTPGGIDGIMEYKDNGRSTAWLRLKASHYVMAVARVFGLIKVVEDAHRLKAKVKGSSYERH